MGTMMYNVVQNETAVRHNASVRLSHVGTMVLMLNVC